MAVVKVVLSLVLFYLLNSSQYYWYPLISWLVNWVAIGSISWFLARRLTRDVLCKHVLPRVDATGKAVLITGCDSGFGHMTAIELNRLGFFVFAGCLKVDGEGAKRLASLAPHSKRLLCLQMNVTSPDEISAASDKVQKLLADQSSGVNQLFAIINNAGIGVPSAIEWAKPDSLEPYDAHVDVNTFGVIRVTRKFLPLIRRSKGRIINLASIASRTNATGVNPYSLSKVATSKFTEGLQEELAPFGVTAIDVNPWFYKTPMLDAVGIIKASFRRFSESTEEVKQVYRPHLEKVARGASALVEDPRLVIQHPEHVVETLVDATTSAEPDAVYRVISPGLRVLFWITNDFLPWELVILWRRFLNRVLEFDNRDVSHYMKLLKAD